MRARASEAAGEEIDVEAVDFSRNRGDRPGRGGVCRVKTGPGVLSEVGREILGALDEDNVAPLEEVVLGLRDRGRALSADEFLAEVLALYAGSLVAIMQEPISGFGQTFPARAILPSSPRDILGDVARGFEEFWASGDYARKEKACARREPAGVPFGIYLVLTGAGRRMRDDPGCESRRGKGQGERIHKGEDEKC